MKKLGKVVRTTGSKTSLQTSLAESIKDVLASGFGEGGTIAVNEEIFCLEGWKEARNNGFIEPYKLIKDDVRFVGSKKVQEVQVRILYKEPTDLGFSSFPIISITVVRNMPVDNKSLISCEEEILDSPWCLSQIKFLHSKDNTKLTCLDW